MNEQEPAPSADDTQAEDAPTIYKVDPPQTGRVKSPQYYTSIANAKANKSRRTDKRKANAKKARRINRGKR